MNVLLRRGGVISLVISAKPANDVKDTDNCLFKITVET